MSEPVQRLARIPLQPDDTLLALLLPRAAGASLLALLAPLFPPDAVCAPGAPPLPHHRLFCLYDTPFGTYSSLYAHLRHVPLIVTMVREPAHRTLSVFRQMKAAGTLPVSMTPLDFIHDAAAQPVLNGQTRTLAGAVRGNLPDDPPDQKLPDAVLLHLAKETVWQAAFAGVAEEFLFSAALLCQTFGLPLPDPLPHHNAAPSEETVSDATLAALRDANALDVALYNTALQRLPAALDTLGKQPMLSMQYYEEMMRHLRGEIAKRDHLLKDPLRLWSGRVARSARRHAKQWLPADGDETSEEPK